jgi:hypothetical protein
MRKVVRKTPGWVRRRKAEQDGRQVQENEKGCKEDCRQGEKKKGGISRQAGTRE